MCRFTTAVEYPPCVITVLAGQSEAQVTAGLSAAEKAELRRLLGIVYQNVAGEVDGVRARVW